MANIQKRGENSWFLTVNAGRGPDGKYIRRTKTIKVEDQALLKTTKRLRDHLDMEYMIFKQEVEAGTYVAAGKMTFKAFVEEWKVKYGIDNLSPTTYKTYNVHLDSRILPVFGHMQINQIKTLHIVTFLKELEKPGVRKAPKTKNPLSEEQQAALMEPLDIGTIQYVYRVLSNVFKRAAEWSAVAENPMLGVTKPALSKNARVEKAKAEKKTPQFYDEEEAQTVVDALYKESTRWRLLILGSMLGGYRRGELIGLEWKYVSFDENTITIENTIPLTEGGEAIEKGPKSISSYRTVDMPEWYMIELEAFKQEWEQEKVDLGDMWKGEERQYVFHNGKGQPYYYQHPSKWWKRFCDRHDIRYIKFHGLRHSMGTLLLEGETNVDSILKVIQERLGHSRKSTTEDIYVHVTKKSKRLAAVKFDKFNRNKEEEQQPTKLKRVK